MSDILPFPSSGRSTAHYQRFAVEFDYEVHFTRDSFRPENGLLAGLLDRKGERRRHRAFVCLDAGVAAARPTLVRDIKDYFHHHQDRAELVASPEVVPGGEEAKTSWQVVKDLMVILGNQHMDRQSYVVAIGGGSVLDMVGFVASLVHRGLRLIRLPTTVLAQNDAGVGVKTGMNEHGLKNFLGTFAPPFAVVNDFSFLGTLPREHWLGGIAEAFKVAIIKDRAFFDFLARNASRLRHREPDPMEELIRRCAALHLEHIATSGDPFELGTARPLDFGHWAAHKLETLSGYRITHGEAVAVGIALDSFYACRKGAIRRDELDRILAAITATGLRVWRPELEMRGHDGQLAVLEGVEEFREHLGGSLAITIPQAIGGKIEVQHMDMDVVEEGVAYLRAFLREGEETG